MKITYQNIIEETLKKFPEYKDTDHYRDNDQELQYSFFAGFSRYINELLSSSTGGYNDRIQEAFRLFNQMIESDDDQLSNLAVVEVIESLVQEKKGKTACQELLSEAGKKQLQSVLKYTGVTD